MGKITMDCDFQPKNMPVYKIDADNQLIPSTDMYNNIVTKPAYRTRYLKPDGSIISKDEYHSILQSGGVVYVAAFVGCTYHCG